MTTPTPPPCDSPKVVMRKSWPNVFPIGAILAGARSFHNALEPGRPGPVTKSKQTAWDNHAYNLLLKNRPEGGPAPSLNRGEGELQIVDQVPHVFHAD